MPTVDRPATPEMKLLTRQRIAERTGKEFNENLERMVMGLPMVENPIYLPENPDRAKETRQEDLAGKRELEEMAKRAERNDLRLQLQERDRRVEELERQMAELMGNRTDRNYAAVAQPAADGAPAPLPDEEPNEKWTMKQIVQWGAEHGVLVPGQGRTITKREAINHVREQLSPRTADPEELDDQPQEDADE